MSNKRDGFFGRRDGHLIRNADSMHVIMPLIYPNRCDNEAYVSEIIDLTRVDEYLKQRNAGDPKFKYTLFHVIVAAMLKVIILRPKLNRFICNKNLYMREHYSASFTIKREFSDDAGEGLAFLYADPDDTFETLHRELYKQISNSKEGGSDTSSDALDMFNKMPRLILKTVMAFMRFLDRHGWIPESIIGTDPYYASVILSNLGSIKLKSGYHHLNNWGTTSLFVIVGEMKKRPFYNDDGSYTMRNSVELGLTIDERLADGYYYSKSIRLLKYILMHPECLDEPLGTPVDYK